MRVKETIKQHLHRRDPSFSGVRNDELLLGKLWLKSMNLSCSPSVKTCADSQHLAIHQEAEGPAWVFVVSWDKCTVVESRVEPLVCQRSAHSPQSSSWGQKLEFKDPLKHILRLLLCSLLIKLRDKSLLHLKASIDYSFHCVCPLLFFSRFLDPWVTSLIGNFSKTVEAKFDRRRFVGRQELGLQNSKWSLKILGKHLWPQIKVQ